MRKNVYNDIRSGPTDTESEERKMKMKRVATVQDISCVGKCSLTVALPIISAMGTEAAIIPTAVLSTHTMFEGFTFKDLTDQIAPITEHWEKEGFDFDALYTGYLGSFEQIKLMLDFFGRFGANCLKVVDPAMGDNGKLYPGFTPAFAKEMSKLCAVGDVILPNLTEACFMLDVPYKEEYDRAYIEDILRKLTALGAKKALLTGVGFTEDKLGVMGYDSTTGEFFEYYNERIPQKYHGTGDIYSSVVVGALMQGKTLYEASALAADFVCECIRRTYKEKGGAWYGVNFEEVLPMLMK